MKITVCEFPDEVSRKDAAWNALVEYVAGTAPDVVVLPEMPFCQWVFTGEAVDPGLWRQAILLHDTMMARLGELKCGWVASSRPVEEGGRRFNEAFLWSGASGYRAIRRDWFSGESWILSPQAEALAETSTSNPFATATIDLAAASQAKMRYPRDLQRMYLDC